MPTIAVFGNVKVQVFGNDHNPPHFHVVTPDGEAIVDIATLRVLRGRLRARDTEAVLEWAGRNRENLLHVWEELRGGMD